MIVKETSNPACALPVGVRDETIDGNVFKVAHLRLGQFTHPDGSLAYLVVEGLDLSEHKAIERLIRKIQLLNSYMDHTVEEFAGPKLLAYKDAKMAELLKQLGSETQGLAETPKKLDGDN